VRQLSTYGLSEYYVYTGAHVDLAPVLASLRQQFPAYRIEYEHRDDPAWSLYRQWLAEPAEPVE